MLNFGGVSSVTNHLLSATQGLLVLVALVGYDISGTHLCRRNPANHLGCRKVLIYIGTKVSTGDFLKKVDSNILNYLSNCNHMSKKPTTSWSKELFVVKTFCLEKFRILLRHARTKENSKSDIVSHQGFMTHVALATSCGCKGWPVGNWMRRFRPKKKEVAEPSNLEGASASFGAGPWESRGNPGDLPVRSSADASSAFVTATRQCPVHRDVRSLFRVLPRKDNGHIMLGVPLKPIRMVVSPILSHTKQE